jgi:hypothetical protein
MESSLQKWGRLDDDRSIALKANSENFLRRNSGGDALETHLRASVKEFFTHKWQN